MHLFEKYRKTAAVAFRCLWQRKLRSGLSILGVVCGVTTVVVMLGAGEGAKRKVMAQIEGLGIRNIYIHSTPMAADQALKAGGSYTTGLRYADIQRIAVGCRLVSRTAGLREVRATVQGLPADLAPRIAAVTDSYIEIMNLPLVLGRSIRPLDVTRRSLVCVLGSRVADRLGDPGRPGRKLRIRGHLLEIVGVLARTGRSSEAEATAAARDFDQMIFIPAGTEKALEGPRAAKGSLAGHELSEILIQVAAPRFVAAAAREIARILEVGHEGAPDYQVLVPLELLQKARRAQRTLNAALGAIAAVALIIGGIGIMNIMLANVYERTREIGIRRAVGATRVDIVTHFLAEAVILTLTGGLIGVVLGLVGVRLTAGIGRWDLVITPWGLLLPLGMSGLVGAFFGLYPAYRAARMNPTGALRNE